MKVQIRRGCFETNSSSVHSLTILSEEEQEGLNRGDFLIKRRKVLPVEQAVKENVKVVRDWEDVPEDLVTSYEQGQIDTEKFLRKLGEVVADDYELIEHLFVPFDYYFDFMCDVQCLEHDVDKFTTKSGDNIIIHSWFGIDN